MSDVQQSLLEVLILLVQAETVAAERYPVEIQDLHAQVMGFRTVIDERALTSLFRVRQFDLLSAGRFIYLEAMGNARWVIPVVSLAWDFDAAHAALRVRYGLFSLKSEGSTVFCRGISI